MAARETVTVTIPADLAHALREATASGEYPSADEALSDALAMWSRRHEEQEEAEAWVRAKINAALDDPSPSLSMEEVEHHLKGVFANARKRRDEAA